jgi:hypothetical protein
LWSGLYRPSLSFASFFFSSEQKNQTATVWFFHTT